MTGKRATITALFAAAMWPAAPVCAQAFPTQPVKIVVPATPGGAIDLIHPSVPARSVPDLITWLKANPDKVNYASSGAGSSLQMATELFMGMSGRKMLHVPYRGRSAAHPDLIGGRTSMIFDTITDIQSHEKSGAVRELAVTTAQRSSVFPDLPTISEAWLNVRGSRPPARAITRRTRADRARNAPVR